MIHPRSSLTFLCLLLWSFGIQADSTTLDEAGQQFVTLGLELGEYDDTYIDTYYGPAEWQKRAQEKLRSKAGLASAATDLLRRLEALVPTSYEQAQRKRLLVGNVRAMEARTRMLMGENFSFVEEARILFDLEPAEADFAEFDRMLAKIDEIVPGSGELRDRINALRSNVVIPVDKLDAVFRRAIEECRRRTLDYVRLPEDERFQLKYVSGVSWGGWLQYVGDNESLMRINSDIPRTLSAAIHLACHEGYPGHHLYGLLADQRFLKEFNWTEFYLLPTYSPAMPIIEGTAEYGVSLVFPENENIAFQRDVLAPIAGIDSKNLEVWDEFERLHGQFKDYAWGAIAQRYLDGEISRDVAVEECAKYWLTTPEEADRRVRFIEEIRSYTLNYSLGEDVVSTYIESQADTDADKWAAFIGLLEELPTASDLTHLQ